ncbi:STAS domain-containing protein [Bacteroidota bacterium]|nr:STAS domain-containing protein [Bacteroidota bacterium]|tara:strand:- start:4698 stop:5045 length:348 start_codon:yes stop_codon:yes gene_type:complete
MFEIKVEKKTNHIWVDLIGKLINEDDGKNMSDQIISSISNSHSEVIINLKALEYINSSGFNNILKVLTSTRNLAGDTILCNANSLIEKLLITTKLNTIFKVQSNIENFEDFLNKN